MDNSLWDFDNFVSIVESYQTQTGDDVGAEYLTFDFEGYYDACAGVEELDFEDALDRVQDAYDNAIYGPGW
jgi:hypothetical protein